MTDNFDLNGLVPMLRDNIMDEDTEFIPLLSSEDEDLVRIAARRHNPEIPVLTRDIHATLAYENLAGVVEIRTADQMNYWANRINQINRGSSLLDP